MEQQNEPNLDYDFDDSYENEFDLIQLADEEELDFLGMEADDDLDDLFFDIHSGDKTKNDDLSEGEPHHSLPPDWKDFDYG